MFTSSKLLKHFSIYIVGRILSVLSSLALLPLFTKKLPQVEFGVVGILWLIIPISSRLMNMGVDAAVSLKFFKLKHEDLSNYLYNALFTTSLLALGMWLLLFFNIDWVKSILDASMNKLIFNLLYLSIFFTVLSTMMLSFMQLAGKAWQNVIFTILPPIVTSAATFYLIIYVEPSYKSYIIGMAFGNSIFGIFALIHFFRNYSFKYFKPSFKIIKGLLKIGIPILPGTLAGLILAAGDRFIIKHFLGLEAVAVYVYGYRFSEYLLNSIFQPFQKAFGPILLEKAAEDFKDATEYCQKLNGRIIPFISIVVAGAIILFKDAMHFLSESTYALSYTIFLVSLMGILLNSISSIYRSLFNHLERTDLNMVISVSCALLNVTLNLWLIPIYGIIAAAFTTVVSFLVTLGLSIHMLNYFIHQKVRLNKLLIDILPFALYILAIYLIDVTYATESTSLLSLYTSKIVAFSFFLIMTYSLSHELRKYISEGYKYLYN